MSIRPGGSTKSSFGPNTTFDSDEQVLLVGPNGGGISRVTFGGRYYAFDTQGGTSNGGAFVINNPAHVDGSEDVSITGTLAGGNGSFFTCIGTNMNVINIHDTQIQNYGESTTTGPYYGVYVNCPNAYVTINGNTMFPGVVGSNQGIAILAAHSAVIGNNSILSAFDAMSFPGFTGQAAVTGNIATNSQDTYSVPSTFGQNVAFGVNKFDKVNPTLGAIQDSASRVLCWLTIRDVVEQHSCCKCLSVTKLVKICLLLLLMAGSAFAQQQPYPLKPFQCSTGQWVYGFNPATHGLPGWFCRKVYPPIGGIGGSFSCVWRVTVMNGIITNAQTGPC